MKESKDIICWWSGGITSAVACKLAIDFYTKDRCRVIMIDTKNEDEDTYRFKKDCEELYGIEIESITIIGDSFNSIEDIWYKHCSLNVATGAICSTVAKREVRELWQKSNKYSNQVFGFEFEKKEFNRAMSMKLNHPKSKPIFPLLMMGYDKNDCIKLMTEWGIEVPRVYKLGFKNNNCFNTGCVQGGIGYWQKMKKDFPEKYYAMAKREHDLTDLKKEPVTMLKDQSQKAKDLVKSSGIKWKQFIFLEPHPNYPELKSLSDMKEQKVEPLFECNGFCGINDLNINITTEKEINYNERTS